MTGSSSYPVPVGEATVELRFDKSRFVGIATRADTVASARSFINQIRLRYPDASHHAFAFLVGFGNSTSHGMSDDGEPSGTAGRPVLAVVQGSGLGDVTIVVTRYFGGVKLGTGGLVRAYTATAQAAIAAVPREQKVDWVRIDVQMGYDVMEFCRKAIHGCGGPRRRRNLRGARHPRCQRAPRATRRRRARHWKSQLGQGDRARCLSPQPSH